MLEARNSVPCSPFQFSQRGIEAFDDHSFGLVVPLGGNLAHLPVINYEATGLTGGSTRLAALGEYCGGHR